MRLFFAISGVCCMMFPSSNSGSPAKTGRVPKDSEKRFGALSISDDPWDLIIFFRALNQYRSGFGFGVSTKKQDFPYKFRLDTLLNQLPVAIQNAKSVLKRGKPEYFSERDWTDLKEMSAYWDSQSPDDIDWFYTVNWVLKA